MGINLLNQQAPFKIRSRYTVLDLNFNVKYLVDLLSHSHDYKKVTPKIFHKYCTNEVLLGFRFNLEKK